MLDLGTQELIIIFIVTFLVFGPKRLPELGKTLGRGIRELKAAMRGVKESIEDAETDVSEEIKEVKDGIEETITKGIEQEDSNEKGGEEEIETRVEQNISKTVEEKNKKKVETDKDG